MLQQIEDIRSTRYQEIRKVTLIGSVIDLLLGVGKIIIGYVSGSHALIADGVHSLSDLATDFLVLFAAKHAHREADEGHPYGHGRIETVTTVALGIALVAVAVGISIDGLERMTGEVTLRHELLALLAAFLSVVSKEWIYQYTVKVGRRLRSNMVIANAWHSRTDAISSVVVVLGVSGVMAGFPYLDGVAAIVVALMIAKIGWDLLWKSLQELIDTALEPEMVEEIRRTILSVDGVRACHMLRTRYSGSDSLVDVHILVDPVLSVSEGHQIGERVRKSLLSQVEHVADVTVHIDPEDDENASPCDGLPMRDIIENRLHQQWKEDGLDNKVDRLVLHYLDGKVHVDVFLLPSDAGALAMHADAIRAAAQRAADIGEVQVYASAAHDP